MDWPTYSAICDKPHVFSRWALEQTRLHVRGVCAESIDRALTVEPLEKPDGHKGDSRTDMFELAFENEWVESIIRQLQRADMAERKTQGSVVRGLGGLVRTWQEYGSKKQGIASS